MVELKVVWMGPQTAESMVEKMAVMLDDMMAGRMAKAPVEKKAGNSVGMKVV